MDECVICGDKGCSTRVYSYTCGLVLNPNNQVLFHLCNTHHTELMSWRKKKMQTHAEKDVIDVEEVE